MTRKSKLDEFIEDRGNRRLYERELLALEATELISSLIEAEGVSRSELARRLGTSKSYVTQLLSGSRNMTVHTLADIAFALGRRIRLAEAPPVRQRGRARPRTPSAISLAG